MKIFKVQLNWDQIIEKIYEYVISECKTFFGVENSGITFKIIPDNDKKTLIVAIYRDDLKVDFQDILKNQIFEFTTANYKQIEVKTNCHSIQPLNTEKQLPYNEIRYLYYGYNELLQFSFEIISQILKLKKYHVNIIKDNDAINYYFSKRFFDLADLNDANIKILDMSDYVLHKFL